LSGTILIVDDVATNRIVLKVKLAEACYDTLQAETGEEALALARRHNPNLILLDLLLPGMDGIEVCRRLKSDPASRDIPVIMMTALSDIESRVRALEAGADEFMTKSHDEMILPARIRSLLRARETENELRLRDTTWRELGFAEPVAEFAPQGNVALVASSRDAGLALKAQLQPHLSARIQIQDRVQTLAGAGPTEGDSGGTPDVFLIAADLDGHGDGLHLMSELRSRSTTRQAAICILVQPGQNDAAVMALDLGANDLITAGSDPREMALRLNTQMRRKDQADRLRASMRDGLRAAVVDPLTGLYNRRYAMPHVARIAERAQQTGRAFAVMILDLDRFKSVNDTWGHAAGDAVLVDVAARLRDNLRPVDMVARIGGEEFLVVLPDTTLAQAEVAAERLRRVIDERPVAIAGGPDVSVTISIGLALGGENRPNPDGEVRSLGQQDVQNLIDQADHAMLMAKTDGRNQVITSRTAA
jgi:two-component system, cell cycle response regulator